MEDEKSVPDNPDHDYYVERHYERLLSALREPESPYPLWFAAAVDLLVRQREHLIDPPSYFDRALYEQILQWIARPESPQPKWLAGALRWLIENVDTFSPEGDERLSANFTYPH